MFEVIQKSVGELFIRAGSRLLGRHDFMPFEKTVLVGDRPVIFRNAPHVRLSRTFIERALPWPVLHDLIRERQEKGCDTHTIELTGGGMPGNGILSLGLRVFYTLRDDRTGKLREGQYHAGAMVPAASLLMHVREAGSAENFVLMVDQYRWVFGRMSLEWPGGIRKLSENFEDAALREWREELGFGSDKEKAKQEIAEMADGPLKDALSAIFAVESKDLTFLAERPFGNCDQTQTDHLFGHQISLAAAPFKALRDYMQDRAGGLAEEKETTVAVALSFAEAARGIEDRKKTPMPIIREHTKLYCEAFNL